MNKDDPRYEARKEYFQNKMDKKLDDVDSFEKKKKKKKGKISRYMIKLLIVLTLEKQKWLLNLTIESLPALYLLLLEKEARFCFLFFVFCFLLFFAKLILKNFICEITETFCFPKENVIEIYKKYMIEKVENFHVLTRIVPP